MTDDPRTSCEPSLGERRRRVTLTALSVILAVPAFLLAEFVILLVLGYTAESPDGTTPDQRPLIGVALTWGVLTVAAAAWALIGTVRRIRHGRSRSGAPLLIGALAWAALSAVAVGVLAAIG